MRCRLQTERYIQKQVKEECGPKETGQKQPISFKTEMRDMREVKMKKAEYKVNVEDLNWWKGSNKCRKRENKREYEGDEKGEKRERKERKDKGKKKGEENRERREGKEIENKKTRERTERKEKSKGKRKRSGEERKKGRRSH
jgi:hypothetical protein